MVQGMQEKRRKRWSREETTGFLRCYLARKAEFEHPKRKRLAYSNVLEDMVSMGITDFERTPLCLESKMRSLLQAYKAARDNNSRTGASPCFAPYMEQMDEMFGSSPIISNNHTVHVGYRPFETISVNALSANASTCNPSPLPSPTPLTLPVTDIPSSPSPSSSMSPPLTSTLASSLAPAVRRKRSARELYYEKKYHLKKLEAEQKRKARSEAIQQLQKMLMEKWEKDGELERRKVALLEKIANRNYCV